MKLHEALGIANGIVNELESHCNEIAIAGSCRRGKAEVKDIEVVCIPNTKVNRDVFGEILMHRRTLDCQNAIKSLGKNLKGSPVDGKYNQIMLEQGIKLDLFMPEPQDYYRQLAIRTGPADYSYKVLAYGWKRIGWCGSDAGLRKISDCILAPQWICVNPGAELPPVWTSEQEFFDWIKVKWVEPQYRTV